MTNDEKNKIANTLTPTKNTEDGYYVYGLFDKSTKKPFYIGKGHEGRVFDHEKEKEENEEILKKEVEENLKNDKEYKELKGKEKTDYREERLKEAKKKFNAKHEKIDDLKKDNKLETVIIKWGLTEKEAFMAESALINLYNYMNKDNKDDELTNIVNGYASTREKLSRSPESKAYSTDDFLNECAPETIEFDKIPVNVLFIKINKLYPYCYENKDRDWAIYEAMRGCWNINKKRFDKNVDFVCALYNKQIVSMYPVDNSCLIDSDHIIERQDEFPEFPIDIRKKEKETRLLIAYLKNSNGGKLSYEDFNKLTDSDIEKYQKSWDYTQWNYSIEEIKAYLKNDVGLNSEKKFKSWNNKKFISILKIINNSSKLNDENKKNFNKFLKDNLTEDFKKKLKDKYKDKEIDFNNIVDNLLHKVLDGGKSDTAKRPRLFYKD